ncbi:hypothetical protein ACP70R_006641 [Stipagrostis hirtigluma subsp. patula]
MNNSTVHGPIVILPPAGVTYPFPAPHAEALQTGGGPNISNAYTINSLPGPLYNCSSAQETFTLKVKPGKTYMLRLINAALDDELFFSMANHKLTVVDVDADYVKPFIVDILVIAPGQTSNVLLATKPTYPGASYYMESRPYTPTHSEPLTTPPSPPSSSTRTPAPPPLPRSPSSRRTCRRSTTQTSWPTTARSSAASRAPTTRRWCRRRWIDQRFFFTVGLGTRAPVRRERDVPGAQRVRVCGVHQQRLLRALPTTALLLSHFASKSCGVYASNFPAFPLMPFKYTGAPPNNTNVMNGTKVVVLPFGTSVELVMQDTSILGAESHPLHLHGFNFFFVGWPGLRQLRPGQRPRQVQPTRRPSCSSKLAVFCFLRDD